MPLSNHQDLIEALQAIANDHQRLAARDAHRVMTAQDLLASSELLFKASRAIAELTRGELRGCTCRSIAHDDYFALDYDKECTHHGRFFLQIEKCKAEYTKALKALRNEIRVKLIIEIIGRVAPGVIATGNRLSGAALQDAINLADQAIAALEASS